MLGHFRFVRPFQKLGIKKKRKKEEKKKKERKKKKEKKLYIALVWSSAGTYT